MRQILLIAWREYRQYIFSRGFLIFLVMFPLGLVAISAAMGLVERNKPTRAFVVFDETGRYEEAIDHEIERRHLIVSIGAWDFYLAMNADPQAITDELIPAPFAPANVTNLRAREFRDAGGFEAAQEAVAPYLKPGAAAFTPPRVAFRRLPLPAPVADAASIAEAGELLRPYLLKERKVESNAAMGGDVPHAIFAAVLIPENFGSGEDSEAAQYWSRNLTDNSLEDLVAGALGNALRRAAFEDFGLPQEKFDEVVAISAPVDAYRPDKETDEAQLGLEDRIETAMPAVLTYMLLVIIFGVGNLLLTNTIEERSNKIVEILLSSVTANQLMMGKLIGIAAVGLTMPTIFLFGGLTASLAVGSDENVMGVAMSALFSSPLLLIYLFYFFCAYAIFAMIFLAIGAVSNSLQDAQSYMGPIMLVVFAPMPFMVMVFQNPNGVVASVLTWIPVYTPYAVMMRIASDPPLTEIIGATLLMLGFAFFLARIMGRIFRQAILQASPPKVRDVWRLARNEVS